jgi:hypothetical protein
MSREAASQPQSRSLWPPAHAGAVLSFLSLPAGESSAQLGTAINTPLLSAEGGVAATTTTAAAQTPDCVITGSIDMVHPLRTVPPPRVLPSLLRFVDGDLMQTATAHNRPPHPAATCSVCLKQWDAPNIPHEADRIPAPNTSTFLPLSPCGHWIHYRCLIWRATQDHGQRNKCHECGIQLFQWEGITALTLATRTGLNMGDGYRGGLSNMSDCAEYEYECAKMHSLIHAHFFAHLSKESRHADGSPDLVLCFYDVLDALQRMSKPQARWLQYNTQTGYLLYGMLVTIKMRNYLIDGHTKIEGTDAWKEFEMGRKTMQVKILAEVHAA